MKLSASFPLVWSMRQPGIDHMKEESPWFQTSFVNIGNYQV